MRRPRPAGDRALESARISGLASRLGKDTSRGLKRGWDHRASGRVKLWQQLLRCALKAARTAFVFLTDQNHQYPQFRFGETYSAGPLRDAQRNW
jgi:hypothetical protein